MRKLDRRSAPPLGVEEVVKGIIAEVKSRGDAALIELSNRFDKADFKSAKDLRVTPTEAAAAAENAVDAETKKAIAASRKNVTDFRKAQPPQRLVGQKCSGCRGQSVICLSSGSAFMCRAEVLRSSQPRT